MRIEADAKHNQSDNALLEPVRYVAAYSMFLRKPRHLGRYVSERIYMLIAPTSADLPCTKGPSEIIHRAAQSHLAILLIGLSITYL